MKIIENISAVLVKWFNALRIKNTFLAAAVQVVIIFLAGYFAANEVIVTPEWLKEVLSYVAVQDLNWLVSGILAVLAASVNTPLSAKVAALEAK